MCVRFLSAKRQAAVDELVTALGVTTFRQSWAALSASVPAEVVPGEAALLLGQGGVACVGRFGFARAQDRRLVLNARSETLLTVPLFAPHTVRGRCLVPAEAFVEWEHDGRGKACGRYRLSSACGGLLLLAGVARRGADGRTEFVIVTRPAAGEVLRLHDRMPLILGGEGMRGWLAPGALPPSLLCGGRTDLVAERA